MCEIVRAQVRRGFGADVWQNERGEQRQHEWLQEDHEELYEAPLQLAAQTEHRPPGLHVDDEQQSDPRDRGRVELDARSCLNQPPEARHELRDSEAEYLSLIHISEPTR